MRRRKAVRDCLVSANRAEMRPREVAHLADSYHFYMLEWADDLKVAATPLYLDSRRPRDHCFVSHAHSDHLGMHRRAIATPATAAIAAHRLKPTSPAALDSFVPVEYGESMPFDADTLLRLQPAGHVLGSAMLHVTRPEGTLLYTGDFKLRRGLTCQSAQPEPADVLVMESTYGQPIFRFPPPSRIAEELVDRVAGALRGGRQPIVMGYSLGKAQEILRILTDAGLAVTLHGAAFSMSVLYERLGVPLGKYRRYRFEDFHGSKALDLAERGVLVAPPHVARTAFVTRFKNPCRIAMTGWALLKDAIWRYGVDHALPLSDHADFDELLELIERVRPRRILTHHGFATFVDELRARGFDAALARPEAQLRLFE